MVGHFLQEDFEVRCFNIPGFGGKTTLGSVRRGVPVQSGGRENTQHIGKRENQNICAPTLTRIRTGERGDHDTGEIDDQFVSKPLKIGSLSPGLQFSARL